MRAMKFRIWFLWIAFGSCSQQVAGQVDQVLVHSFDSLLLVHQLTPTGPIPTAYDPDGVYPYVSYCETSDRPHPVLIRFI